ncbi:hypothetical protein ACFO0N_05685 [Halobium salinum]|uniref:Uncharacterized protein n=1 Tax=Halobium salinum TaxID=1364940 RepID=A0ABD5P988_9EURY|nr:hypothetical protein [Halobium salinum]
MSYTWQYYDVVLVGIFLSMTAGATVGLFTAVSLPLAVLGAGAVAALIMAHGLFVNGPVDAPRDLTDEVEPLN